ncbi:uncharacterized protein LOC144750157 [Ciona intestinalis]
MPKTQASSSAEPASSERKQPRGYSINLPTFWPSDPQLWIAQVEAQFNNKNIQDQRTRFDLVVASLSPEYAAEVRDVIISPPEESPFNRLKEELVNRTTVSERKRLQQLLSAEVLGDRKPTQFLRHMRQLLGQSNVDSAILSELFLQRLPANVRMILSANESLALEDKAKMADSIMNVIPSSVNSVLHENQINSLVFQTDSTPPLQIPAPVTVKHNVTKSTVPVVVTRSGRVVKFPKHFTSYKCS